MLAPAERSDFALPDGHPCLGCDVRSRALCGVLGVDDLAGMKTFGWTIRLGPGQTLFHEGDPATRVFTLTKGTLKLYKLLADGRRHVTGFMHPGDFLGISVDDEHAFTAEALEDALLCSFPRNRFDNFVEIHPPMERELYRMAAHELAAAHQQMLLLGRKNATERLASFLLYIAERTAIGGRKVIHLPMSRLDIADYLGLTKETVSRVLSALKRAGVIRLVAMDEVEFLDRERLGQIADCEF